MSIKKAHNIECDQNSCILLYVDSIFHNFFIPPTSLSLSFSLLFLQKQIILFASIFAVIFASKDQLNGGGGGGGLVTAESGITTNHIYSSQPIQDNIAAESEVAKRGAASVSTTSSASGSESQGQSSQIDVGKNFFSVLVLLQCLHCCIAQ